MFGFERDEVIGRDIVTLVLAEESHEAMAALLDRAVAAGPDADHPPAELVGRRRSGEEFPVEVALWPLQTGEELTFNAFIRDITERKLREERVTFLAYHDQLTGLPNRTMFEHHLDLVLARAAARRHRGRRCSTSTSTSSSTSTTRSATTPATSC